MEISRPYPSEVMGEGGLLKSVVPIPMKLRGKLVYWNQSSPSQRSYGGGWSIEISRPHPNEVKGEGGLLKSVVRLFVCPGSVFTSSEKLHVLWLNLKWWCIIPSQSVLRNRSVHWSSRSQVQWGLIKIWPFQLYILNCWFLLEANFVWWHIIMNWTVCGAAYFISVLIR